VRETLPVQIKGSFQSIKNFKNFEKGQMVWKFPRKFPESPEIVQFLKRELLYSTKYSTGNSWRKIKWEKLLEIWVKQVEWLFFGNGMEWKASEVIRG